MKLDKYMVVMGQGASRPHPQMDCAQTQRKWHHPWCEDDTCTLGWGIVMHQVMVWAKAADHHGCFRHKISAETRVNCMTQKVS